MIRGHQIIRGDLATAFLALYDVSMILSRLLLSCMAIALLVGCCSVSVPSPEKAVAMKPAYFATESEVVKYDAAGNIVWRTPSGMSRDVQLLPNGNVLFPFNQAGKCGGREVNPAGKTVWEYSMPGQAVISARRLKNGNTLLGASVKGAVLVVNPAGDVIHEIKVRGDHKRHATTIVRETANGNIIVVEEDKGYVTEYTLDGKVAWEYKVPFRPFGVEKLKNGHVMISGQSGLIEVNQAKEIVWELKNSDVAAMGPRWFAGFQILKNGNILVCNAGGTVPFFEVNRDKKVVWHTALTTQQVKKGHGIFLIQD
jgi:hypothetical protein